MSILTITNQNFSHEVLKKDELVVVEIYKDCLKYEDGKLLLVVSNTIEESKVSNCLEKNFIRGKICKGFQVKIIV